MTIVRSPSPHFSLSVPQIRRRKREGKSWMMKTHGEPESRIRESFNCPHFQRNTCLIHFACCSEWYPCHKCHNDALKRQENDKSIVDNSKYNFGESDIVEEGDDLGEGSSNATGISHELEATPCSVSFDDAKMELRAKTSDAPNGENPETATDYESLQNRNDRVSSGMVEYSVGRENKQTQQNTTPWGVKEKGNAEGTSFNIEENLSQLNGETSISSAISSGQAAEGAREHEGLKDEASTGDIEEENLNTTNGSSNQLKNNEEMRVRKSMMQGNDEDNLQLSSVTMKEHVLVTSRDGGRLKCTACDHIQSKFCQKCENGSCGKTFSSYFCPECKLLIESNGSAKLDPYHCGPCGVCRLNKEENFHCNTCNVCMPLSLKDHKCFDNRGHDPCAICFEEVFSGAVILPCFHMIHEDCGVKLILSGSYTCPMCRGAFMKNEEEPEANIEQSETGDDTASSEGLISRFKSVVCLNFYTLYKKIVGPPLSNNVIEMNTMSA